jgi:hypothetical protein
MHTLQASRTSSRKKITCSLEWWKRKHRRRSPAQLHLTFGPFVDMFSMIASPMQLLCCKVYGEHIRSTSTKALSRFVLYSERLLQAKNGLNHHLHVPGKKSLASPKRMKSRLRSRMTVLLYPCMRLFSGRRRVWLISIFVFFFIVTILVFLQKTRDKNSRHQSQLRPYDSYHYYYHHPTNLDAF